MDATATTELRELQERGAAAASRISDLERAWRSANEEVAAASARLSQAERAGASPSTIRKIEGELAAAKAKAAEPWAERVEGARAAARDVERQVRTFVGANLDELVRALEADGQAAADQVNAAASALVSAHAEWEAVAAQIGKVIATVARPAPGDVSFSRADEVARAAAGLVAAGGENGPVLDRTRDPWALLLGQAEPELEETETVAA